MMKKRILIYITCITMLAAFWGTASIYAAEGENIKLDSIEKTGEVVTEDDGKIRYEVEDQSLFAPPVSLTEKKRAASSLPSSYSLKDALPEVREQLSNNNCWAYGALASLESGLIKTGRAARTIDLSENHLTWFTYNGANTGTKSTYAGKDSFTSGDPYNEGGNRWFSTATLARWYGAVNQSRTGSSAALASSLRTVSDYRLKNAYFLPDPQTETGRTVIKQYLMTKGAVDVSYYDNLSNYSKAEGKSCYYGSAKITADHEVAIVGWDDTVTCQGWPNAGAWLVRNSWGSEVLDAGYFYLSYYDKSICDPTFFEAESKAREYASVYQYDGVGHGDAEFSSSSKISGANRFVARKDALIKAVGTYTLAANSTVTVSIYVSPSAAKPTSGVKAYSKSFSVPYAGYHTLELGTSVGVPKGYAFSVIMTSCYGSGSSKRYMLPVEVESLSGGVASIDYSKNQSYILSGSKWYDVTQMAPLSAGGWYDMGNALVKAYAANGGSASQAVSVTKSKYTKTYGNKAFSLGAKRTKGTGKLYYKTSSSSVATVSSSGKVTIKGPGKASITVAAAPTTACKSASKTISLTVKPKKSAISSVKSSKSKTLTVKWKKDAKATGYQVVIAKNKSFKSGKKSATIRKNATTSKTFKKLSSGKTYYAKVRAYKTVSGKKLYGAYSKVKKCRTK
ncbi:lectin like domain-containing protein [bacterium 210820-DFI.6.37]|nr:lectin like domain-containing protein [bacterium 210820-DFI.6.37]